MTESLEEILSHLSSVFSGYVVEKPSEVITKGFRGLYIDVYVLRKVKSPIIFRNTERTELTYTTLDGRLHVEVYSRKFKAPEKITGLRVLKEFGQLPKGYLYNALTRPEQLNNPVSVLYGDSVTAGEQQQGAQIPSRILYSWALSPQEYHCVAEERTHNALSEMGTMWETQEGQRGYKQTLFKNIYMKRGHLLQLVSFYNVSLEELVFGLGNILHTHSYGAEDNVNARALDNSIIAVILSKPFETPITPYTVIENIGGRSCDKFLEDDVVKEALLTEIKNQAGSLGFAEVIDGKKLEDVVNKVNAIYSSRNLLKELAERLAESSDEFYRTLVGQ
ncbi:MAG: type I-D CRISPR-associated protein Cas7/Csc2 [Candidatus Korarchaeota archaeon]|nr:type I-D CRISPR-associated protein Cas7/Csc2 [Candidatus Korarchaeota archaeon]